MKNNLKVDFCRKIKHEPALLVTLGNNSNYLPALEDQK
jgi:hypothetical protein